MLIFVSFADISRQVLIQSLESFFLEIEIRLIDFSKHRRIYALLILSHIDELFIGLFIIVFSLKSLRIGISHFMDIHHHSLPKHLETGKNRRFFSGMALDI